MEELAKWLGGALDSLPVWLFWPAFLVLILLLLILWIMYADPVHSSSIISRLTTKIFRRKK